MFVNLAKIFNLFYPNICCICKKNSDDKYIGICRNCLILLPRLEQRCARCKSVKHDLKKQYCNKCISSQCYFNNLFAMYPYSGVVKDLLHKLKYSSKLEYGNLFSVLLKHHVENVWYEQNEFPSLVIPVPLHINKFIARGFNQTEELSRKIKYINNINICNDLVVKYKTSSDQASLSYSERKNNLLNCFKINPNSKYYSFLSGVYINGQSNKKIKIAILDDVVTTMATTRQISMLLQQKFNVEIDIWCICRA